MVRRLKDRIKQKYSVVLAEVGGQDTWQRAVIGFAVVGSQRSYVEATLGKIAATIERMGEAEVAGVEREVIAYGDGPMIGPDDDDSWIPDAWLDEAGETTEGEGDGG